MPRRRIDEILVRYRLEPHLRDVYVEGPSDKKILDSLFEEVRAHRAAVYTIETVEVPTDLLQIHGLTEGNRQRVVALALVFLSNLEVISHTATCWIDSDFEIVLNNTPSSPHLILTDYACIEGYLWDNASLVRILQFFVGGSSTRLSAVCAGICRCIRQLYLLRAAAALGGVPVRWLPFKDFVAVDGDALAFDGPAYLHRALVAGGLTSESAHLLRLISQLEGSVSQDCRHAMNWHDAIELLSLAIKRLRPALSIPSADSLALSIFVGASWATVSSEPSVHKLIHRVTN